MYHYTSLNNFDRIVKSRKLCLTDLEMMNDPLEISTALDVLDDYLKICFSDDVYFNKLLEHVHDKSSINLDAERIKELVVDKKMFLKFTKSLMKKTSIYVMSFSHDRDSLPLWINYSNSNGVSLKVNEANVADIINNNLSEYNFVFKDVEYISKSSDDNYFKINNNELVDYIIKSYTFLVNYAVKDSNIDYEIETNIDELHESIYKLIFNIECNVDKPYIRNIIFPQRYSNFVEFIQLLSSIKEEFHSYEKESRLILFKKPKLLNECTLNSIHEKVMLNNCGNYSLFRNYLEIEFDDIADIFSSITLAPYTNNIPIDIEKIKSTIIKYIKDNSVNEDYKVPIIESSNCKIRW